MFFSSLRLPGLVMIILVLHTSGRRLGDMAWTAPPSLMGSALTSHDGANFVNVKSSGVNAPRRTHHRVVCASLDMENFVFISGLAGASYFSSYNTEGYEPHRL